MAFFQDLGKKISGAAQDASKKTSELIEISKLNGSINAEKSAILEVQKKIGGTIYSIFAAGEQVPEAVMEDVQAINQKNQNIIGFENKIAEIKAEAERYKEASAAAAAADAAEKHAAAEAKTAAAQNQAAAPAQASDEAPAGEAKFCLGCGAPLEAGMMFCSKCGHKNE